jgi:hypothetical protein
MPRPKKKKATKKYKDIYDFIAISSDEEFDIKQKMMALIDLNIGGFMILERIKVRGYYSMEPANESNLTLKSVTSIT